MPGNTDTEAWLRFTLTQGLGCRKRLKLLREFGTPGMILGAGVQSLRRVLEFDQAVLLSQSGTRTDWPELMAHIAWLAEPDNQMLTLADAAYPPALLDLPDAPPVIFVKGNPSWLLRPALSLVGSRQATPQGLENAEAFAAELSRTGFTIISGLASGIDAAAHQGGLMGAGSTVAVVGTGLDRVYPASNRKLAHRIAEHGALVSEFVLGSPPIAVHFPRRNRLIAALGLGCLVVEATLGSGSLITARQAADLGREVFAIPGSIHSPQSKGVHSLIKQGAKLVESAQDIHDELVLPALAVIKQPVSPKDGKTDPLLEKMGWDPVDIDTLSARTNMGAGVLNAALLTMELDGLISVLPGGRYQRKG